MKRTHLIAARLHKHWTQEQAAGFLGTSPTTLSRWERGIATPHPFGVQSLCEVYGRSAWELGLEKEDLVPEKQLLFAASEHTALAQSFQVDLTTRLFALVLCHRSVSSRELSQFQGKMTQAVEEFDVMNSEEQNYQISRREALGRIVALPLITFGLTTTQAVCITQLKMY